TIPAGGVSPADPIRIGVEGGFLNLGAIPTAPIPADTGAGTPYVPGDQFIIRPNRADIDLNIGAQSSLTVNNVGLDVFGGIYSQPYSYEGPTPSPADMSKNLFELIGKAIAFVETNSQTGSQEILALCQSVNSHLGLVRTTIGARMNRAETIAYQLESLRINETDRLSDLEDVDLGELMTRLAQQELAYRSVLQSSSIIMQLSLMNYI
ncbi:MAG: flagellar biosynthesis protein FlgL, partial [Desulfovibrionaceae bacterium]|nr:flagellar biosynthesis protein FlgL [Desulfovibrionaceae bacterium]